MGVTCVIDFDNNPYGTYFAGQVVTGKVTLKLDKLKLAKAVTLNINGFAETHWTESRGTGKDRTTDTYRGREDYIASQTYLVGSNFSTEVSLEPGVHVYNFTCQIPATCPSSIEGHFGRIRYMTKVSIVRPWKFDQSYTRCFTVLKMMDLNYDSPLLRVPAHCESLKTYCCWPCTSDPLQLQLTLPQTGFVPGQICIVDMLVTNDSHIRVEQLQISLVMMVTYHASHFARTSSKNERIVVTKLMGDPVPNHCKKQFKYSLRLPATPPTCFNLCRIIQIAYQVEVEAKVKGFHRNEVVKVPLTIGSVPLTEHLQMQPRNLQSYPAQTLDVAGLEYSSEIATAPPGSPGIPPPNYEEAVHMRSTLGGKTNEEFEGSAPPNTISLDGSDFSPRYPIFNIPTAPMDVTDNNNENFNSDSNANKGTWL
ncbi:arrestin domain-containing protein 2-like [Drosophila albomicans]|uniref:Arrestin domain-containing protein 2-like n=1 Tax=Drosophila albomicans TaxID=7291 RepID=A0A6P8XI97_DROAB|nr:arrestin domain-containing protein 2-like [Drosophila albomicans]